MTSGKPPLNTLKAMDTRFMGHFLLGFFNLLGLASHRLTLGWEKVAGMA